MKIIGINGSHRLKGNCDYLLKICLASCEKLGAQTKLISLADKDIQYCKACDGSMCKSRGCLIKDDMQNILLEMESADGIIIASPVYMGSLSGRTKAFMDRSVTLRRKGFKLGFKVGAAIAVGGGQGGGQEETIKTIHNFFLIHNMTIVGNGEPDSHFGVVSVASGIGDAKNDVNACKQATDLGARVIKELQLRESNS